MSVNIHGKEYFTVAERVGEIHHATQGKLSITTEIISNDDVEVIMKATIHMDGELYTGHALERHGSTMINKTSALENCETSAIGRALAAAGYAGTEYASADEVANAISNQKSVHGISSDFKPKGTLTITPKQIVLINKLINSHVITEEERAKTAKWLDKNPNIEEASEQIDKLQTIIKERKETETVEA